MIDGDVLNITTQLQDVVSQATATTDQTSSNLVAVASVFTQISNLSLARNGTVKKEVTFKALLAA